MAETVVCRKLLAQLCPVAAAAVHIERVPHHNQLGVQLLGLLRHLLDGGGEVFLLNHPGGAGQQFPSIADGKPGAGVAEIHCHDLHPFLPFLFLVLLSD